MTMPILHPALMTGSELMTLHTSLDGLVSVKSTGIRGRRKAQRALSAFRSANWTNPLAEASLWSGREMRYIEKWRGGQVFGPVDKRHPLERLYDRAIRAGLPVAIADDRMSLSFNRGARS